MLAVPETNRFVPPDSLRTHALEKLGTVNPELLRIMVGARLARVLDHLRWLACREEVNRYRAAGGRSERARGGYAHFGRTPRGAKRDLARRVEMPIALIAVRLAVDLRKIVPHAKKVLMFAPLEHLENACVSGDGGLRECCRIPKPMLIDGHGAEQQILAEPVMNTLVRTRFGRAVRELELAIARDAPYFAKIPRRAERGRHTGGHGHLGRRDVRGLGESHDSEDVTPPRGGACHDLVHAQIIELEGGHALKSILPPSRPVGGTRAAFSRRCRGRCLRRSCNPEWRPRRACRRRTAGPNRSCSDSD